MGSSARRTEQVTLAHGAAQAHQAEPSLELALRGVRGQAVHLIRSGVGGQTVHLIRSGVGGQAAWGGSESTLGVRVRVRVKIGARGERGGVATARHNSVLLYGGDN
eukprot:scaffold60257_cov46-Phaeocystis_antarctica.AAC.5